MEGQWALWVCAHVCVKVIVSAVDINCGPWVLMWNCFVYCGPVRAKTPTLATESWFHASLWSVSLFLFLGCLTKTHYIEKSLFPEPPELPENKSSAVATLCTEMPGFSACIECLSVRGRPFTVLMVHYPKSLKAVVISGCSSALQASPCWWLLQSFQREKESDRGRRRATQSE